MTVKTEAITMRDEREWSELGGGMYYGSVVIVCYWCSRSLAIVQAVGMVGTNAATRLAERDGWLLEPSDLWACPDCKDEPQPEHEVSYEISD